MSSLKEIQGCHVSGESGFASVGKSGFASQETVSAAVPRPSRRSFEPSDPLLTKTLVTILSGNFKI